MTHVETPDKSSAAEVVPREPREPRVVGGHVLPWPRRLVYLIHRYGIFIAAAAAARSCKLICKSALTGARYLQPASRDLAGPLHFSLSSGRPLSLHRQHRVKSHTHTCTNGIDYTIECPRSVMTIISCVSLIPACPHAAVDCFLMTH